MQTTNGVRKRPVPETAQVTSIQAPTAPTYQYSQIPDNNADFDYDFTQPYNPDQMFGGGFATDATDFVTPFAQQQNVELPGQNTQAMPSTDLIRRARNQALTSVNAGSDQWNGYGSLNDGQSGDEDEQELGLKVQMAKHDAQGKRKQIPPFVQKLSSFLDSNNTDLIRWSDDGRSFIVLDEDEFARTLIPELFKHNNYASFVRQLNMYGFHKTVNITDGSLRQSEKARKGVKPPSMYSHAYFRKNRPDLLWLIQKPSGKPPPKRKRGDAAKDDSDDDRQFSPAPEAKNQEAGHAAGAAHDLATLPRNELASVRSELQKLQAQQHFISQMIAQLKKQNEQFYHQASAFQALHDRHENSINAILTFLATFLSRNLDGNDAQNLVNMFNNQAQKNQQQQGSVVGEYSDVQSDHGKQMQRYIKRPPLLLEAPASTNNDSFSPANTSVQAESRHVSQSPSVQPPRSGRSNEAVTQFQRDPSASPAVKNDAPTPDVLQSVPENNEMMDLINSVNASNANQSNLTSTAAPSVEFNSALNSFQNANGKAPLTTQQRNDMLALMAHQQGEMSKNNALLAPQTPPMPNLDQFKQTQQQLEMLTNMQKQQDERVQELHRRLQPLSPTGSIPGLAVSDENPFDYVGGPSDFDPNAYVNFDDWGNADVDFSFADDENNGDSSWNFGGTGNDDSAETFGTLNGPDEKSNRLYAPNGNTKSAGRVSSVTSADSEDDGEGGNPGSSKKRQRVS